MLEETLEVVFVVYPSKWMNKLESKKKKKCIRPNQVDQRNNQTLSTLVASCVWIAAMFFQEEIMDIKKVNISANFKLLCSLFPSGPS